MENSLLDVFHSLRSYAFLQLVFYFFLMFGHLLKLWGSFYLYISGMIYYFR